MAMALLITAMMPVGSSMLSSLAVTAETILSMIQFFTASKTVFHKLLKCSHRTGDDVVDEIKREVHDLKNYMDHDLDDLDDKSNQSRNRFTKAVDDPLESCDRVNKIIKAERIPQINKQLYNGGRRHVQS